MTTTERATEILNAYHKNSAADTYLVGFLYGKTDLYAVELTFTELTKYLRETKTSSKRGACLQIRISIKVEEKALLIYSGKAEKVGTAEDLKADEKYNKGDNFEKLMLERLTSETWHKNSTAFWKAGDISLNGTEIQVKFDGGELTNEKTMVRNGLMA